MRTFDLCRLVLTVFAVLGLLALVPAASQAAVTGKIAGIITDSETGEPLPGVNVIIEGTTLGAAASAGGEYFIIGVPPGIYSITASIIGFQKVTVSDVRVAVARTRTLDFSMKSTAIEAEEAITVTAERPIIIKDLTATASRTDAEVFETIALQDVREVISLNAGILRDTYGNLIIRGGEVNQLRFYVDGVSMEQWDTQENWNRMNRQQTDKFQFNVLGVQEMEVITGGFNAEYGDAQSGIVNIVSKEGGGAYHGEFRIEYRPPGQYHFGPYAYDHQHFDEYETWGDWNNWLDWNQTRSEPKSDAELRKEYKRWERDINPGEDNHGVAYDYRKLTYKRAVWGIGGPIVGNKVTFFFSGEYRQNPSLFTSPFRYFHYHNLDFNVTYRIAPRMKLRAKAFSMSHVNSYWTQENSVWDNNSMSRSIHNNEAQMWKPTQGAMLTWTHTIAPTTFYEVMVSAVHDKARCQIDETGYPEHDWWLERQMYGGRRPPTSNVSERPRDGDVRNYRYRADFTSQIDPHNQLRAGTEGRVMNGYNFVQQWFGYTLNYNEARAIGYTMRTTSRYFAAYVQDKMEYGGMIANLGFRLDHYDANYPSPADKFDPFFGLMLHDIWPKGNPGTRPNETHTKISPRIGFSHPIGENTALHFQYGHFYQQPSMEATHAYGTYGHGVYMYYYNPDLGPGKTVSYEFGVQHNIRNQHRVNVVMYFNDLTEQAAQVFYHNPNTGRGADRFTPVNENVAFGNSKGFELTVDKTGVGKWYYRATYTLSRVFTGTHGFARRWSDDPADPNNWNNRMSPKTRLRGSDRTHRITGMVSFRTPRDWGKGWGEWDLSLNWTLQSGLPYTYTTNYEESISLVNNRRYPIEQVANFMVRKWIQLGRIRPQFFLRIDNLLNNRWIYPRGSAWLERNRVFLDRDEGIWSDGNWMYHNYKNWYNKRRSVQIGVGLSF